MVALPLGISVFTFQSISYLIDARRGVVAPQSSLLKFAMYKSMFPQLIAGPIVRTEATLYPAAQAGHPIFGAGGAAPRAGLHDRVMKPDLRAAGVGICSAERSGALPGVPLSASQAIARYRRPGAPAGRPVIITDSFGEEIAPDFVEYFGEVLHIRTNLTPLLTQQDRAALMRYVLSAYYPDRVLLLYHDAAVFGALAAPVQLLSSR